MRSLKSSRERLIEQGLDSVQEGHGLRKIFGENSGYVVEVVHVISGRQICSGGAGGESVDIDIVVVLNFPKNLRIQLWSLALVVAVDHPPQSLWLRGLPFGLSGCPGVDL